VDLRANSDYFSIQHSLIAFYNPGTVFTARYELGLLKSDRYSFVLKGLTYEIIFRLACNICT